MTILQLTPVDINSEGEIPPLADLLYQSYLADGLEFTIDVLRKTIDFLPELFPGEQQDQEKRRKQIQILRLEIIIKFCQYAENVAALALAFKPTYRDANAEKIGLFKAIKDYGLGGIVDFYNNINRRNSHYIAKIVGYPPLDLQDEINRPFIERSCDIIREELTKIAHLYEEFQPLHYAYKHGYRLFPGIENETNNDAFAYIDSEGFQKAVILTPEILDKIISSSRHCKNIIKIILSAHNERSKHEESGGIVNNIRIPAYRKPDQPPPDTENLKLLYPNRGQRFENENKEGEDVYNTFKEELEKNHIGKIVALDLDEKRVITMNHDLSKVIEEIRKQGISSRLNLRRISKNASVGIEIY